MSKTILITGATDGIGLEAAKKLVMSGCQLLVHGRNSVKLNGVVQTLTELARGAKVTPYVADLARIADVRKLAVDVAQTNQTLDVLINNAGVFQSAQTITVDGLDVRFAVNTVAPYLLSQHLTPMLGSSGRVINVSSAAQAPVDRQALAGERALDDMAAYAQSKLAITMWSAHAALNVNGPVVVAVNPGSMLASKMVKEAFGVAGNDIQIGADILVRAALSDDFGSAPGKYFDNDSGQFSAPHPDASSVEKNAAIVHDIETILNRLQQ